MRSYTLSLSVVASLCDKTDFFKTCALQPDEFNHNTTWFRFLERKKEDITSWDVHGSDAHHVNNSAKMTEAQLVGYI